jgi:hypothetical protein
MKREETYRDWIETYKRTQAHPDLVESVMREIHQAVVAAPERVSVWLRLIERIDASTWMKAAVLCVTAAVGIGRVVFGVHLLFAFRLLGM